MENKNKVIIKKIKNLIVNVYLCTLLAIRHICLFLFSIEILKVNDSYNYYR